MKTWYEEKQDNTDTYNNFNVVNVFLSKSKVSTKADVNQIIRKLCTNDLEIICSLEYDNYSSTDNPCPMYEKHIQR